MKALYFVTSKSRLERSYDEICTGIACILHQISSTNDEKKRKRSRTAPFVGADIPDIGITAYLKVCTYYITAAYHILLCLTIALSL
jgi:hypothetical protein